MQKSLTEFEQLHPRPFKGTQAEAQQTQDAMTKAADSLQRKSADARAATQQATQQLAKLSEAMKSESAGQQLADAYKLKQMLDKQIQTFGKCANPGAGGGVSDAEVDRTASEARETLEPAQEGGGAGADAGCVWPAFANGLERNEQGGSGLEAGARATGAGRADQAGTGGRGQGRVGQGQQGFRGKRAEGHADGAEDRIP